MAKANWDTMTPAQKRRHLAARKGAKWESMSTGQKNRHRNLEGHLGTAVPYTSAAKRRLNKENKGLDKSPVVRAGKQVASGLGNSVLARHAKVPNLGGVLKVAGKYRLPGLPKNLAGPGYNIDFRGGGKPPIITKKTPKSKEVYVAAAARRTNNKRKNVRA